MGSSRMLRWVAACTVAGCVVLSACDSTIDDDMSGATGSLRLLVTDKPYPVEFIESAVVTIERIEVRMADVESDDDDGGDDATLGEDGEGDGTLEGDGDDGDSEDDDDVTEGGAGGAAPATAGDGTEGDDSGDVGDADGDVTLASGDGDDNPFIVIFDGERSFNLLDLQNGRTDLLAEVEIPAGTYDQMRVFVSGGEVTLVGGAVFTLKVPSGAQSGIKLHFEFEVTGDETTELLLDIDLSRVFSVIPGGKIDSPDEISGFHFRPSIAMRLINVVDAGAIAGTVAGSDEAPLAGVFVVAFADDEEMGGAITEEDGGYMVAGLPTGVYRLEYSLGGYEDAEVTEVSVTAGSTTENVDVTMTAEPEGADAG